jgi:hypothetical protein
MIGPVRRVRPLVAAIALVLVCAACGGSSGGGGVSAFSCVGPWLDQVPPNTSTVAAAAPVAPGDSLTVYGHRYTDTCDDTGQDEPLQPLPPVHLTLTLPGGAVEDLGVFTPAGDDMGFSVVVHVPAGTPAGVARIRDDQEYPAVERFRVSGNGR